MQMVNIVQATQFVKSSVNWTSSFVQMGSIQKAAKMQICVYPGDEIMMETCVQRNALPSVPITSSYAQEHFKEPAAEENLFALKRNWMGMGWNVHLSVL